MRWFVPDKDYVAFLHSIDHKVQHVEYGNRFKPFFGIILTVDGINYYQPISSPKAKHQTMKNSKDFYKLIDEDSGTLIAVLNLNNMIPIPDEYIVELDYNTIEKYRTFHSDKDKEQYLDLLRKELSLIKKTMAHLNERAQKLYMHCVEKPGDSISQRCCNFKLLEENMGKYSPK